MATIAQYENALALRQRITRQNAGLRMSGKADQQVVLPTLPPVPTIPHLYVEGEWQGNVEGWEDDDIAEYARQNFSGRAYMVRHIDYRKTAP
jgi:glutaredoxin-related protein